jgi:hypothetical protein
VQGEGLYHASHNENSRRRAAEACIQHSSCLFPRMAMTKSNTDVLVIGDSAAGVTETHSTMSVSMSPVSMSLSSKHASAWRPHLH